MNLTISWLDDNRADWASVASPVEALKRWRHLETSGARKVEVKNDDGDPMSREEIERMAAQERAAQGLIAPNFARCIHELVALSKSRNENIDALVDAIVDNYLARHGATDGVTRMEVAQTFIGDAPSSESRERIHARIMGGRHSA